MVKVVQLPAIIASDLVKNFGGTKAVANVSFEVKEGEFFGLLGPNGAGKTTTIRMLTGVMNPDSGRIEIMGIDLLKHPLEAKQKMGVIPEVGTVYPDLSAMKNLDLVGRFYGLSKKDRTERAVSLLDDLGLTERKDDLVKRFSKGMRQRVSIACAIIQEPSVLFLDEPTEGLDVQSRRLITEKVKQMNRNGSTVILTTHNIEEASRLCERVCIINKGKVIVTESPERLRSTFDKVQSVEVSFDRKIKCDSILLDRCISRVEEAGDKVRIYTSDPDGTIQMIMRMRDEQGLRIVSMSTVSPTLEDVFVKLTEVAK